jgi:hypothetical protein
VERRKRDGGRSRASISESGCAAGFREAARQRRKPRPKVLQPSKRTRESPRQVETEGSDRSLLRFGSDRNGCGVRLAEGPAGESGLRLAGAGSGRSGLASIGNCQADPEELAPKAKPSGQRQRFAFSTLAAGDRSLLRFDAERPKIGACFDRRPQGGRSGLASIGSRWRRGRGSPRCPSRTEPARGLRPPAGTAGDRQRTRAPPVDGRDRGQAEMAWCETPKGAFRAKARRAPTGERHEVHSAATRPTQREPPRDPAAAVAGTVGVGSNASPHLLFEAPFDPPCFCRGGEPREARWRGVPRRRAPPPCFAWSPSPRNRGEDRERTLSPPA